MLQRTARTGLYGLSKALKFGAECASYAAAGLQPLADVRQDIEHHWRDFGNDHDWTRDGLFTWERLFYSVMLRPTDRILVVGCGTGRDLIALLERGYRVEGVDLVGACIDKARANLAARGRTTPLYVGSIESVELSGTFDAFIFSWFCYGYIPQAASRIRVLRRVKSLLSSGGQILISYVPRIKPVPPFPTRVARLAARIGRAGWSPEPGDVIGSSRGRPPGFYEHQFGQGELGQEARAAGLTVRFESHSDNVGTAVLI